MVASRPKKILQEFYNRMRASILLLIGVKNANSKCGIITTNLLPGGLVKRCVSEGVTLLSTQLWLDACPVNRR